MPKVANYTTMMSVELGDQEVPDELILAIVD